MTSPKPRLIHKYQSNSDRSQILQNKDIDFKALSYTFGDKSMSIWDMGTAEQLFLVTYFAVYTKKKLAITNAYRQLRGDVLSVYMNWLKINDTDDYVTIITTTVDDEVIMEGVTY